MLPCCPNVGQLRANCPALADGREGEVEGRRWGASNASGVSQCCCRRMIDVDVDSGYGSGSGSSLTFWAAATAAAFWKEITHITHTPCVTVLKLSRQHESHNKTVPMTASEKTTTSAATARYNSSWCCYCSWVFSAGGSKATLTQFPLFRHHRKTQKFQLSCLSRANPPRDPAKKGHAYTIYIHI